METLTRRISEMLIEQIRLALRVIDLADSDLEKSIEANLRPDGFDIVANFYARFVISGRRPGARRVPVEALLKWIKNRGISGRDARGRFISQISLAFAIQNSIYKNGIRGRDFLTPAFEAALPEAEAILADAFQREMLLVLDQR